jgi:hypothetical protein
MKGKKTPISYSKERVILSDVLPFEIPITYSNRHLYNFLVKNKIKICNNNANGLQKIIWEDKGSVIGEIIKLLFGLKQDTEILKDKTKNELEVSRKKDSIKFPFSFKIFHKDKDFRDLTIIHPKNQLDLINFYDNYRDTILYYSDVSQFSIRKPHKVARYIYQKSKTKKKEFGKELDERDNSATQTKYENLRHYFHIKNMGIFTNFMSPTIIINAKRNIIISTSLIFLSALIASIHIQLLGLCSIKKLSKTHYPSQIRLLQGRLINS